MQDHWTLTVTPDGEVRTLWTDTLDLSSLGTLIVTRVSQVEWEGSGWVVRWEHTGTEMFPGQRFAARADALAAERDLLMTTNFQGVPR
jgi:hypothetical protein